MTIDMATFRATKGQAIKGMSLAEVSAMLEADLRQLGIIDPVIGSLLDAFYTGAAAVVDIVVFDDDPTKRLNMLAQELDDRK
jgi:hypothetical protein